MLSVAIAYLIHWNGAGLDLHWAFLIVFALYLLIAALLGSSAPQGQAGPARPRRRSPRRKEIPRRACTGKPLTPTGCASGRRSPPVADRGVAGREPRVAALRATCSAVRA